MGSIDELTATDGFRRIDLTAGPRTFSTSFDLLVRGWIADASTKRPATSVDAWVDALPVPVRYGFARNDVAVVTGHPEIEPCGYRIVIASASLAPGEHVLRIAATQSDGSLAELGPLPFELVAAESAPGLTDGFDLTIDTFCGDNVSPSQKATIEKSFTATVRGSIRDRRTGDGATTVQGVIDYFEAETAQLGFIHESDALGRHTGFLLCFPTSGLTFGAHELHVLAHSISGHAQRFGPFPFVITPIACDFGSPVAADRNAIAELAWIDVPEASLARRRRVTRADVVHLRGWILEAETANAVGEAFVAFGNGEQYALHARQYRPDVAALHRSPKAEYCGVVGSIAMTAFSPGEHDGRLYARSKDDQSYYATDVVVRLEVE